MHNITLSSFGEMLRMFRKRKQLTQQKLAAKLGVHRNTIGFWERGDVLPESRGMMLELAKLLRLDDQEARQLLEASLTGIAPHWGSPYRRDPFFTGREDILDTLHRHLSTDQVVALTQSYALHGLGGIGKTQLAVEYAYRHALEYSAVFWVAAESSETILSSLLAIAELLRLSERQEADQQRVVVAVQRWLINHSGWLLIWDNLEDLESLERFLPPARQGAILITTRRQALGGLAQGLELPSMGQEEGMLFLLKRTKVLGPETTSAQMHQLAMSLPTEYAAAQELVTVMGGLPLALDQAGAYIEETGCGLSGYLQRYQRQRDQLLSRRGVSGGVHPQSVTATFILASQCVERDHPVAADLLYVCAFLHAEAIPEELFVADAPSLGPMLDSLAADPSHLDLAVAALRTFSLVQRHPETRTLSLHRLVQAVLWEQMGEQERALFQQRAIRMLNATFPEVTHEAWKRCERLLPHALTCAAAIPDQGGNQELVEVLRKAADYLRERAQYKQAEPLYERALRIWEQMEESEPLQMASSLNGLAMLYYRQGKYEQAKGLYERALRIWEQAGAAEHPQMASSLHGLALLYTEQGKYEQAEPLYERALRIREHVLGPEHPEVASSLNGLAMLSDNQGNYVRAEGLYLRALRIREQALGPAHPDLASPLNNLAFLYTTQGKYEQAELLHERALRIREQALGPENILVAYPLNNLAALYYEQGKYEQAESLYKRTLHIWKQGLGSEHPLVAHPLNGLAMLYHVQGKYEQAESLYEQAMCIREQALGSEHPQVAHPLNGLANLYTEQGKYEQAEPLYERAIRIWKQGLGPEHPEVASPLNGLANLYTEQGKHEQAELLYQRALTLREQHLGQHHPDVARSLASLATLYKKQGKSEQARPLLLRACTIFEERLGQAHPETVRAMNDYCCVLERRRRATEPLNEEQQEYAKPVEENLRPVSSLLSMPPEETSGTSEQETDPLEAFLAARCELYPQAWSRASELWQAYEQWVQEYQERFPLSRRAFTVQLKMHNCRADRTKAARIWRGITLAEKGSQQKVTQGDANRESVRR